MNRTRTLWTLLVCAALAGCGSSVELDESQPAAVESRGTGAAGAGAGGITDSSRTVRPVDADSQRDPLNDPGSILSKRSIYFDFDSFVIKDEFRPVVEAHARFLTTNRTRRIAIQGNTDDRGSREYNLALGQKRAEAVRRSLAILGVGDQQMEAVSFGEERPRSTGGDETAHAENRRADIVYQ